MHFELGPVPLHAVVAFHGSDRGTRNYFAVGYEVHVRLHLKPTLGRLPLDRLEPAHVQRLFNEKLKAGMSPKSVRYMRGMLRNALNQAVRWAYISTRGRVRETLSDLIHASLWCGSLPGCYPVAIRYLQPMLGEERTAFNSGSGAGIRTPNLAVNRSLQPVHK